MGLELELLPSQHQLPPIRTAAAPPTPPRPGVGDNATDVGGGGYATPKSAASVNAAAVGIGDDNAADVDGGGYATPKSAASVLRAPSACPPAPRKPPRPAKRKQQQLPTTTHHRRGCSCAAPAPHPAAPVRWFIAVPHDVLAAVFVARPASAPCPPTSPPSKKIRVHVVG